MKLTKITAAVAALAVSGTASAFAPGTAHQVNMYLSGASAQDKSIAALVTGMCKTGTPIDVFKNPGKTKYTAWSCTLDSASVAPATFSVTDPTALIQKRSAGGSGIGVDPVMHSTLIDFMPINTTDCTMGLANATGGHDWTCNLAAAGVETHVSDFGVSDVNPELFVGQNTPAGASPVNTADVTALLTVKPAAALVFGVPVTLDLRNALQTAQFGAGNACIGSETEACMPSLSSNQVASIMSGNVKTWDRFYVAGTSLTTVTGVTAPADTKVQVCRRVNGSGTQAQNNAVFLRYPCTSAASGTLPVHDTALGGFFGPVVYENSGSGDVNNCLADFNDGTNTGFHVDPGTGADVANNTGFAKRWAIGLQALEKNANLAINYRFVKVDGVAPTLVNAANGTYKDWVEQSYQWRKTLAGDNKVIAEHIAATAANPAFLGNLDATKFNHSFGISGFLAVSTFHTPAANGVLDLANPVIPYTHAPVGFSLDNCRIPTVSVNSSL